MKRNKILSLVLLLTIGFTACKKQLDITNINSPTPQSAENEAGVIALAQGSIYRNGFYDLKFSDGVYGRFWAGTIGFQELQGDIIGAEAANAFMNQIGCPNKVTLDNGTVVVNPSNPKTQYELCRYVNQNAQGVSNTTNYMWSYMYNMITAANAVLEITNKITFSGSGASTKKATLQAWAYWWKGFAYGYIGSQYYAGIIQNASTSASTTNGNYVTKEAIIAESNSNYDKAITAINAATSAADYSATLGKLIPAFLVKGKGGILSTASWIRSINTMKARNILVNKLKADMTAGDWANVLSLTNNGVNSTDLIFTARTDVNGSFIENTVADKTAQNSAGAVTNTYKLSERLIQDFRAGDQRRANNVLTLSSVALFNTDRGNVFNTRYSVRNNGAAGVTPLTGVVSWSNQTIGANEISIAATYEENELMKAEALIMTGQIAQGVASIDAVRTYQGAGLAPLSTSLTQGQAYEELRSERRIALIFKGLSFWDARRWDIIAPDKGRTGCTVVSYTGVVSTNATIVYGFLDYWDVPDNELAYNPAAPGSAPTSNPKK